MEKDSSPSSNPPLPPFPQLSPEQLSTFLQSPQIDSAKYPPNLISWANTISSYYNQHILQLQEAKLACLQKLLSIPSHNLALPIPPFDLSSIITNNIQLINSNLPLPTSQNNQALNHYLHHLVQQCQPQSLTTPTQTHLQQFLPSLINFPSTTHLQIQDLTFALAAQLPIHFPNLKSLTILSQTISFQKSGRNHYSTPYCNALLEISKNKQLQKIVIKQWSEKDDDFVETLTNMPSLKKLFIPFEATEQKFMKLFLNNRNIEGLNLNFASEPQKLFDFLYLTNPGITHLEITEEILISQKYFKTLCKFKDLTHLKINKSRTISSIRDYENLSAKDIAILLKNLNKITKLNIKSIPLIHLFLQNVEECLPGLEEIYLKYQKARYYKSKCRNFPRLSNLKKLMIDCSGFTEGVVKQWIDSGFKLKVLLLQNIDYLKGEGSSSESSQQEEEGERRFIRFDRDRQAGRRSRQSPRNRRFERQNSRDSRHSFGDRGEKKEKFTKFKKCQFYTFVNFLSMQTGLEVLKIGAQNSVTGRLLMTVSSLSNLRALELKKVTLSSEGLAYLSKLRNLRHFYFTKFGESQDGNIGWFLRILRNNHRLKLYENYFLEEHEVDGVREMYEGGKGKLIRNMRVMGRLMRCRRNELVKMATIREGHHE